MPNQLRYIADMAAGNELITRCGSFPSELACMLAWLAHSPCWSSMVACPICFIWIPGGVSVRLSRLTILRLPSMRIDLKHCLISRYRRSSRLNLSEAWPKKCHNNCSAEKPS